MANKYGTTERQETLGSASVYMDSKHRKHLADPAYDAGGGHVKRICEQQVNLGDLQATIMLMLDWIKDVKQFDGIAEWSWKILGLLFTEI